MKISKEKRRNRIFRKVQKGALRIDIFGEIKRKNDNYEMTYRNRFILVDVLKKAGTKTGTELRKSYKKIIEVGMVKNPTGVVCSRVND